MTTEKPRKLYRHRKPEERLRHAVPVMLDDRDLERLKVVAGAMATNKTNALRLLIRERFERMHPGTEPRTEGKCKCGNRGLKLHACPYDEDLHDDKRPTCNCCKACQDACAREL